MSAKDNPRIGTVYLIHFENPVSTGHTCQHYIGWANDLPRRIQEHMSGHGARLTQVACERGIRMTVAKIWTGTDRNFERRLKNRHNGRKLCPICNGSLEHEWPSSLTPDVTMDVQF